MNDAGEIFRDVGLALVYHPYNVEFFAVNDEIPFDYLMSNTDPELVKIKLDTAWLSIGGMDPVEYFEKYAGRVVACCIKDWDTAAAMIRAGASRIGTSSGVTILKNGPKSSG